MSSTRRDLANVNRKLTRSERVSDADLLNLFLGVHSVDLPRERSTDLVDPCFNVGTMWHGVPYQPLRCDISPAFLPDLDHVADWSDLPMRVGQHVVKTIVADPPHMRHNGQTSVLRALNQGPDSEGNDILAQVATLLDAAHKLLHPTEGTLILKIADQVHGGPRQWQPDKVLDLAEQIGLWTCDRWVNPSEQMPQTRRHMVRHLPSQVHWLALHSGPRDHCPGPGFVLPGRIHCAYCGRVVAVDREREPGYCRLATSGRSCRQLAYLERRQLAGATR